VRLTKYTDYALRVLIYLAARPEEQASVTEISKAYRISQNHLTGMRLARAPGEINVGAVIRRFEDGFDLVDCGSCVIAPSCQLRIGLNDAVLAFLKVVDGLTLADLILKRAGLVRLLDLSLAAPITKTEESADID
jgi:Rrf2 family transcriptional regulator, nitric oxide-sensitive transcriptional repressor